MYSPIIFANRYVIDNLDDALLGKGGVGTVYRGVDKHTQKEVAINARFGIYCAQQASQSGHNLKRFLHRTRKSTSNLVPIFVSSAPLNALKILNSDTVRVITRLVRVLPQLYRSLDPSNQNPRSRERLMKKVCLSHQV